MSPQGERPRAAWDRWQRLQWSTPTDRRAALQGAGKALSGALEALGALTRVGGGYLLTDPEGEPLVTPENLARVLAQIESAEVSVPTPRGRPPDMPRVWLVRRLARDWEHQTGLRASVTHDPYSGERGGRFAEYALERAAIIGVELTLHQLEHCLD